MIKKNIIPTRVEILKDEKGLGRTLVSASTPGKPGYDGDGDGFTVNPATGEDNVPFRKPNVPDDAAKPEIQKEKRVSNQKKIADSIRETMGNFRARSPFGAEKGSKEYMKYANDRFFAVNGAIGDAYALLKDLKDQEDNGTPLKKHQIAMRKMLIEEIGIGKRYRDSAVMDIQEFQGQDEADAARKLFFTPSNIDSDVDGKSIGMSDEDIVLSIDIKALGGSIGMPPLPPRKKPNIGKNPKDGDGDGFVVDITTGLDNVPFKPNVSAPDKASAKPTRDEVNADRERRGLPKMPDPEETRQELEKDLIKDLATMWKERRQRAFTRPKYGRTEDRFSEIAFAASRYDYANAKGSLLDFWKKDKKENAYLYYENNYGHGEPRVPDNYKDFLIPRKSEN